ncbi:MAG: hypothetical protein ABR936_12850 [Bacteroidota bacterium]
MSTENNSTNENPNPTKLDELVKSMIDGFGSMGKILKESFDLSKRSANRSFKFQIYGFIIAFLALVVAVIMMLVTLRKESAAIQSDVFEIGNRVERVQKDVLARQFRIVDPVDDAIVDRTCMIRGKSPFPGMKNYIVVTPLKVGGDVVQNGPLRVSPSGLWVGEAILGSAEVGAGEKFLIRCIATDSALTEGTLTKIPNDAIFSESITVIRKTNGKE